MSRSENILSPDNSTQAAPCSAQIERVESGKARKRMMNGEAWMIGIEQNNPDLINNCFTSRLNRFVSVTVESLLIEETGLIVSNLILALNKMD